jgi:hypothetical protein
LTPKHLPGENRQTLIVCRITRIEYHPVDSDVKSSPERIFVTEKWLEWNGDFDNPNACKEHCAADIQCAVLQDNGFEHLEYP